MLSIRREEGLISLPYKKPQGTLLFVWKLVLFIFSIAHRLGLLSLTFYLSILPWTAVYLHTFDAFLFNAAFHSKQ